MEQISAPLPVLDTVLETAEPVTPAIGPADDPARAWLRLNDVEIPKNAPLLSWFPKKAETAIDLLRSRLIRQIRQEGVRKLAITSPTTGCGAEAIAAQLGLALSRQSDSKVMIFDFNMHDPKLARLYGLSTIAPRHPAVTQDRREFDSSCLRVGHNLALSLASEPLAHSAELLATRQARQLIDEVERDFDPTVMLFVLPPVLGQSDVVAAADLYDAALMVVQADKTTAAQADRAETLISEQKPCLGVVMNRCRFAATDARS
jgi:Mrp family chromosome partitioning ATPase